MKPKAVPEAVQRPSNLDLGRGVSLTDGLHNAATLLGRASVHHRYPPEIPVTFGSSKYATVCVIERGNS